MKDVIMCQGSNCHQEPCQHPSQTSPETSPEASTTYEDERREDIKAKGRQQRDNDIPENRVCEK